MRQVLQNFVRADTDGLQVVSLLWKRLQSLGRYISQPIWRSEARERNGPSNMVFRYRQLEAGWELEDLEQQVRERLLFARAP